MKSSLLHVLERLFTLQPLSLRDIFRIDKRFLAPHELRRDAWGWGEKHGLCFHAGFYWTLAEILWPPSTPYRAFVAGTAWLGEAGCHLWSAIANVYRIGAAWSRIYKL